MEKNLRELDVAVAEKVFNSKVEHVNQKAGWRIDYRCEKEECNEGIPTDWGYDGYRLKYYSTNIKHAWELVEWLHKDGWALTFYTSEYMGDGIGGVDIEASCKSGARGRRRVDADTLPEAVCLMALKVANETLR